MWKCRTLMSLWSFIRRQTRRMMSRSPPRSCPSNRVRAPQTGSSCGNAPHSHQKSRLRSQALWRNQLRTEAPWRCQNRWSSKIHSSNENNSQVLARLSCLNSKIVWTQMAMELIRILRLIRTERILLRKLKIILTAINKKKIMKMMRRNLLVSSRQVTAILVIMNKMMMGRTPVAQSVRSQSQAKRYQIPNLTTICWTRECSHTKNNVGRIQGQILIHPTRTVPLHFQQWQSLSHIN